MVSFLFNQNRLMVIWDKQSAVKQSTALINNTTTIQAQDRECETII